MPFTLRPYRGFPVPCSVTYHAGPFLKLLLAYCLGFWSFITLLVLSSEPAYAEWVEVGTTNNATVYVDPDTIRRKGDLVKMWQLLDYKKIETSTVGSYLSRKTQREFDCVDDRQRLLAVTDFSDSMGKGEVVFSGSDAQKWEPIAPESLARGLWEVACGKK